jgi:DNA-directed RNA polymerase specialized sigma24 family protein
VIVADGRGGWAWFHAGKVSFRAHHVRRADGRAVIDQVIISTTDPGGLSSTHLREMALRSAEAHFNGLSGPERAYHERTRADVDDATQAWEAAMVSDEHKEATRRLRRSILKLRIPTDRRKPDAFYARVARGYSALAAEHRRPAAELAEINGVPVTTVHRWVKEARARGLLPPGSTGKAG